MHLGLEEIRTQVIPLSYGNNMEQVICPMLLNLSKVNKAKRI